MRLTRRGLLTAAIAAAAAVPGVNEGGAALTNWFGGGPGVREVASFTHDSTVTGLAFSPDGRRLLAASFFTPNVYVFDVAREDKLLTIRRGGGAPGWGLFSHDGGTLILPALHWGDVHRSRDVFSLVDAGTGTVLRTIASERPEGYAARPAQAVLSRGGGRLASMHTKIGDGGKVCIAIFDTTTWTFVRGFAADLGVAHAFAWSPDETRFAVGGYSSRLIQHAPPRAEGIAAIAVHDAATGEALLRMQLPFPQDAVQALAWSPDGGTIAAAGIVTSIGAEERERYGPAGAPDRDERVFLFDAATGALRDILKWPETEHHGLAYSPDGRVLAVLGGTLFTLATTDGRGLLDQRAVVPGGSRAVAWRPDSRQIAYGDKRRVRVLELAE